MTYKQEPCPLCSGLDCTECPWFEECNTTGGCPWLGILADRMRDLGVEVE